ncbi:amino acid ABC transporter substrate-binding protein [Oceanospirillum linum]|uniref:Amino acid ABC transporter substrate-binding protein n=1 Tax=Oceanospirillum linum TaxID=966 RepID=A0A1T1HGU0_OCELI|nr:amino acid ABC transporter substrate-binding protein [Oceanospirillum linum]
MRRQVSLVLVCSTLLISQFGLAATKDDVVRNGDLNCGVFPDDPGRSAINDKGRWEGFYVDFCRATAAAVLGNPEFVNFIEVGAKTRFTTLMKRQTDVVMYSSTWTLGRENKYQIEFPAIYLLDGQGFMVRRSSGIRRLSDLQGKRICVTANTTTHNNLVDTFNAMGYDSHIIFANGDSFFRGSCDAYTADRMNLATNRANRADNPKDYIVLPEMISREPIGPKVRNDDPEWSRIIRSVVHAVILAEEKGITSGNIDQVLKTTTDVEVMNLLGKTSNIGTELGLDQQWAYRVIKAVGNYGEIYNRHFGLGTPINMERGLNRLWNQGGALFAPPFK